MDTTLIVGRLRNGARLAAALAIAAATAAAASTHGPAADRWYTADRVERGAGLYQQHCAACHGQAGEGAPDWRTPNADGRMPPPPLDGSGHTWHHPVAVLGYQIKFGAPGGQGAMPGFDGRLDDQQIADIIAWFQSHWPDRVYAEWLDIERRAREQQQ